MIEDANYRKERIARLLHELRYEIERGIMDNDIDETLSFKFVVPLSRAIPDGMVLCQFTTRPVTRHMIGIDDFEPRLKIVK